MLSELEAKLGEVEGKLESLLGSARAQIAAMKAQLKAMPQGVTDPLGQLQAKVSGFGQQCKSQTGQMKSELDQLLPP